MDTTLTDETGRATELREGETPVEVILADGTPRELAGLDRSRLIELQWEQERAFARQILDAPKGSPRRGEALRQAYETVTRILSTIQGDSDKPLVMGLHPRYERLVRHLLGVQRRRGLRPSFFEVGYGSGTLLKRVSQWGFPAAGIEVCEAMHQRACELLGADASVALYRGDLLGSEFAGWQGRYSLVYWNDVFEHVPPDEILDYLRKIHDLLVPGGQLVTITPNWHMRPWDITRAVCPLRTEAAGLHLKEYTLREVSGLLREAGFAEVATPLFVVPSRMFFCGRGLIGLKRRFEPFLESLRPRAVHLLCRAFGLCETIATKSTRAATAG